MPRVPERIKAMAGDYLVILDGLCHHHELSPSYEAPDEYGGPQLVEDCGCDACESGRHRLAIAALRLVVQMSNDGGTSAVI
jgi:hypothetical protein